MEQEKTKNEEKEDIIEFQIALIGNHFQLINLLNQFFIKKLKKNR